MHSPVLIATGIASLLGFILNCTALYLVISRGRKLYHYLFAGILLACAIWDLGILLLVVRNAYIGEVALYAYVILPAGLIPALIYHFTYEYTGRTQVRELYLVWGFTVIIYVLIFAGQYSKVEGVYRYDWGNIFRLTSPPLASLVSFIFWFSVILVSCRFLYRSARTTSCRVSRRHCGYLLAGFLAMTVAVLKALVTMGIDLPFLLPMGMILNDFFVLLIAVAIVKDSLLDITIIIKKGAVYSGMAASIIFVFSFSEHVFATYLAEWIGSHSEVIHMLSIAVVIAVLMPFKHRLEHFVESYFAQKKLEF